MRNRFSLTKLKRWRRFLNEAQLRKACDNAYLGGYTSLARVLGRYKMYVDTRDVAFTPHILFDGFWEMPHTEIMANLVKPGMTALDIGANHGYFTLIMADRVGPEGKVHAFEPNPHIAALLRNTVEINGFASRTSVHEIALSDEEGEISFYIDPTRPMNATLIERENHEIVKVTSRRFDDMPELAQADIIKIDVEGAEQALWAGMQERLKDTRPLTIILEFTSDRYQDAGAFVDAFVEAGFALSFIHQRRGIVATTQREILAKPGEVDQLLVLSR